MRSATDRRTQLAAGVLTAAGAAAVAGKVAADHLGKGDGDGDERDRSYRLKTREAPSEGIRRIALGRAENARGALLDAKEDGDLAESIHAARKDLKKLRAVLRLVRGELGEKLYRAENRRYRDAGRLLSSSRDAEVKLETLDLLYQCFGAELPREARRIWREALEGERDEIAIAGKDELELRIDAALSEIESGCERIPSWPLKSDSWRLVESGLKRSYRRGRREMKRTRSDPSAENVHEWRKRAKDLWHQLRILGKAWPPLVGETAEQTHGLADLLGDHHDLDVLTEDLKGRDQVGDRGELESLIARRQKELLGDAFEIGDRLFAEKPEAFRARFKVYWLAWRHPMGLRRA